MITDRSRLLRPETASLLQLVEFIPPSLACTYTASEVELFSFKLWALMTARASALTMLE